MMEGLVEGSNGRGRPRLQYLRNIADDVGCVTYEAIKSKSLVIRDDCVEIIIEIISFTDTTVTVYIF